MKTHVCSLINKLADTTSTNEKKKLLAALKDDSIAREVFVAALDPYVTYGVLPERDMPKLKDSEDADMVTLWDLLRPLFLRLSTRQLTGKEARNTVKIFQVPGIIDRILTKDLRCGVAATPVNAVIPGLIPEFNVSLADEGLIVINGKIEEPIPQLPYPVWSEPKYDGVRVITTIDSAGEVLLQSRNGKPYDNFPRIKADLEARVKARPILKGSMFDGEVLGATFDETMTVAHRKTGTDDTNLRYQVWDGLPLGSFKDGIDKTSLRNRQLWVAERLVDDVQDKISRVPGALVTNVGELLALFLETRKRGFEGLVIKDILATYAFKRSTAWMKMKEMYTREGRVNGFAEGKGKFKGSLGALQVTFDDGTDGSEVGTGFTNEQRADIWEHRKKYINKMVEVKFQERTARRADGTGGSLRFPVFLRWRPDRD